MKKVLGLIYAIPIYVILIVLNNCRTIFNNIQEDLNIFNNISYFSISLFLILFITVLYVIFRQRLKEFKSIWLSIIGAGFLITLLNGIFVDKNIANYFALFIYLLFVSLVSSIITRQRFEISLFLSVAVGLIVATFLGMFNILFTLKYILLLFIPIGIYYIIKNRDKLKDIINTNFNGWSVAIFSLFFVLFIMGGINRYVHVWDEYSHWAYDAKAVIEYDKLSTCEEVVSSTRTYPPVMSLWHYFVAIFVGYSEQNLYIGLSIFILIGLMTAFSFINNKNKFILPLFTIVIMFGSGIFGSIFKYSSLYADYISGVLYFVNFAIYALYKDDNKRLMKYLFLSLIMTIWIKPSGIIAAFVFFIIIMTKELLESNDYKISLKGFWKVFKKWYKLGFAVVGMFLIWNAYVSICDKAIPKFYDRNVLSDMLEGGLSKIKFSSNVLKTTIFSFFNVFSDTVIYGFNKLSLFHSIVLGIAISILIVFIKDEKGFKYSFNKCLPLFFGYFIFMVVTVISIFVMFSVYEAQVLASFVRYLDTFYVAVFLFMIVILVKEDFILNKNFKYFSVFILFIIVFNLSFKDITFFVSDYNKRNETRDISYSIQEKWKLLIENTSDDSKVYVIDQQDKEGIMAMWHARFYAFPRRINAYSTSINWKVRTDINGEDLGAWGLTSQELAEDLYKFDYLYLYSADEYFFEEISFMLQDVDNVEEYTLFKVQKNSDKTVSLLPVI